MANAIELDMAADMGKWKKALGIPNSRAPNTVSYYIASALQNPMALWEVGNQFRILILVKKLFEPRRCTVDAAEQSRNVP